METKTRRFTANNGIIGCLTGPVLLFGLHSGWTYIHGQVLDSGDYKYDTVAYSWSDGLDENGSVTLEQFYGAHIYTVRRSTGFDVYCEVHIGRDIRHDCGHLGRVSTLVEARKLWGQVEWTSTDLIVGDPTNRGIKEPRKTIQRHR
jgi:hypothetical protein